MLPLAGYAATVSDITVNADGTLSKPDNFWTANAAGMATALSGSFLTGLSGHNISELTNDSGFIIQGSWDSMGGTQSNVSLSGFTNDLSLSGMDGSGLTGVQMPLTAGTDYLTPTGDGSGLTGVPDPSSYSSLFDGTGGNVALAVHASDAAYADADSTMLLSSLFDGTNGDVLVSRSLFDGTNCSFGWSASAYYWGPITNDTNIASYGGTSYFNSQGFYGAKFESSNGLNSLSDSGFYGDGSGLTGVQMPLTAGTDYLSPTGDGSGLTGVPDPSGYSSLFDGTGGNVALAQTVASVPPITVLGANGALQVAAQGANVPEGFENGASLGGLMFGSGVPTAMTGVGSNTVLYFNTSGTPGTALAPGSLIYQSTDRGATWTPIF